MSVVVGLSAEHPTFCTGGPCESRSYPDGTREDAHMRELPAVDTTGAQVWMSRIQTVNPDGTVRDREIVVGLDSPSDPSMTADQAEQLARDLTEAVELVRAATRAGAR